MQFHIITIFPHIFDSYFSESILKIAQKKGLIKIKIHNLRDYTKDKHKTVDDKPYGGGPGMILKVEPIYRALRAINLKTTVKNSKTVMLTPAGKTFNQKMADRLAKLDQLILLCGRYEGFDHRVEKFVDEKISIGDFVLSGGELPAMIVIEAITRLIPGVLGSELSVKDDTFSKGKDYIKYPQYTRPAIFKFKRNSKVEKLAVPSVLLSGDHKKIFEWRKKHIRKK